MRRPQFTFSLFLAAAVVIGGAGGTAHSQSSSDFVATNTNRINKGHYTGAVQANASSENASMSDNGRFIVFESVATNLIDESLVPSGLTDGRRHIYLFDRQADTVEVVSLSDPLSDGAGREIPADSFEPAVSNDGRYVAFASSGDMARIVPIWEPQEDPTDQRGDLDFYKNRHLHYAIPGRHIYVRDRLANRTLIISQVGLEAWEQSNKFDDVEANLVENCEPDLAPALVKLPYEFRMSAGIIDFDRILDPFTGHKRAISSATSSNPRFSSDGNYIIYETDANNLVVPDGCSEVSRKQAAYGPGVTGLIPIPTANATQPGPRVYTDTEMAAIIGNAVDNNLVTLEHYVVNRDCRYVKKDGDGPGNGELVGNFLGRFSTSTQVSFGYETILNQFSCYTDSGTTKDVVMRQGESNKNGMLSMYCKFFEPGRDCVPIRSYKDVVEPDVSADGTYVVFSTDYPFIELDDNKVHDVYLVERKTILKDDGSQPLEEIENLVRISNNRTRIRAANGASRNPVVTGDGRFVAYQTEASDISANDTNGVTDIVLFDRRFNDTFICSKNSAGALGNAASTNPAISSDGTFLTFQSTATNFGVNNGLSNVFLATPILSPDGSGRVQDCNVTAVVSIGTGIGGNAASSNADVGLTLKTQSGNGATIRVKQAVVSYQTNATDLASAVDSNASTDVHQAPNCSAQDLVTDTDGDGTVDCFDQCYKDRTKVEDVDTDGDGVADCEDGCPSDSLKIFPLFCGCGVAETDLDLDQTPDCADECPTDPDKIAEGDCGCGVEDLDLDDDGTSDCLEEEPPVAGATPTPTATPTVEPTPSNTPVPSATPTPDPSVPLGTDAPPMPRLVRIRVSQKRGIGSAIFSSTARVEESEATFEFRLRAAGSNTVDTIESELAQVTFKRLQVGKRYAVSYRVKTADGTTSFSREKTFKVQLRRAKQRASRTRR